MKSKTEHIKDDLTSLHSRILKAGGIRKSSTANEIKGYALRDKSAPVESADNLKVNIQNILDKGASFNCAERLVSLFKEYAAQLHLKEIENPNDIDYIVNVKGVDVFLEKLYHKDLAKYIKDMESKPDSLIQKKAQLHPVQNIIDNDWEMQRIKVMQEVEDDITEANEAAIRLGFAGLNEPAKEGRRAGYFVAAKKYFHAIQSLKAQLHPTAESNILTGHSELPQSTAANRVETPVAGGWIAVEDDMPEHNLGVLVFIPEEDFHITSGMWDIDNKWVLLDDYRVVGEGKGMESCKVTHWMKMPDYPDGYEYPSFSDQESNIIRALAAKQFKSKPQSTPSQPEGASPIKQ